MKQRHMRTLDRWVGVLACWVLTLHRRLFERARDDGGPPAPRKLMFIKLIEQGATVIAYDAIVRAVAAVGRENVYFAVFAENRPIVDLLDLLPPENIVAIRDERPTQLVADLLKFLAFCRRTGIDATIDMEFYARAPAILAYLTGASVRVGLHRFTAEAPYRGDLLTHRLPHNPYVHTAMAYRALVDACFRSPGEHALLGFDTAGIDVKLPRFEATGDERERVRGIMAASLGREPTWPIILLNPNASDLLPIRKWPLERFRHLAARILAGYPSATIVVTGAPSERAVGEAFARDVGSERVACLAGRTSLRELFVLYELADVLVTNDSGPGHFSTMTDIHAIVMFGPETPVLFGPLGKNSRPVWKRYSCSPCVNVSNHRLSPCNKPLCMEAISVDEIYGMVAQCVEERRALRSASSRIPA